MKITLKAARINSGMTQTDVANLLNKSVTTIVNWETGKCDISLKDAQALCGIYHVDIGDIFFADKTN